MYHIDYSMRAHVVCLCLVTILTGGFDLEGTARSQLVEQCNLAHVLSVPIHALLCQLAEAQRWLVKKQCFNSIGEKLQSGGQWRRSSVFDGLHLNREAMPAVSSLPLPSTQIEERDVLSGESSNNESLLMLLILNMHENRDEALSLIYRLVTEMPLDVCKIESLLDAQSREGLTALGCVMLASHG